RARQDGVGDLVQLGRGHHEDDVRRRLLDRFQQCVERGRGELVHLVDDEDLVLVADRRDREARDHDLAYVVDAGVAGGVDLEDVDVAPLRDLDAGVALTAWIRCRTVDAVERAREDSRGRGLAAAPRPGEHERLRNAPAGDRIAQRTRDRLLADDLVEPLRTPFASQYLIRHPSGRSEKWKSGKLEK